MPMLSDESKMPYGTYKGTKMANVPAHVLIWQYENNKCSPDVREYVKENLDVLKKEIKKKNE